LAVSTPKIRSGIKKGRIRGGEGDWRLGRLDLEEETKHDIVDGVRATGDVAVSTLRKHKYRKEAFLSKAAQLGVSSTMLGRLHISAVKTAATCAELGSLRTAPRPLDRPGVEVANTPH
jgi:hypothetical protein